MPEALIAFIQDMDRCWVERRFGELSAYLADDVVMVAPGGRQRVEGADAAIDSYREFMSRCELSRFDSHGHVVTRNGDTAIVEYDWNMAWSDQGTDHEAKGREILVLAHQDRGWRVVWRTQIPA
jgi:ketosteroid isomerase-like protein